jgi:hypothetical protein
MLQELLQPRPDVERGAVGRTTINRDVLMYFSGHDGVHACCVCDVTSQGDPSGGGACDGNGRGPDPQRQSPNRSSRQSQAARWRHHTWSLGVSFPVHNHGPAVEPVRSQSYRRSLRSRDDDGECGRDAPLRRQRNSRR